jgi:FkbM family methyltransferase
MVAREILRPHNYLALCRMWRVLPRFRENAGRYFLGRGAYPYHCEVRTPSGTVTPTLYSTHDMWTVNEVFCRRDYGADRDARVIIDVGSNIGLSALYFLTRNPRARVWAYEPVPRNIERLRRNLDGFEERYELHEAAVAPRAGRVSFGVEDSGRYGGIGLETGTEIDVECLAINDVLETVLAKALRVDVLKVDTEGSELEILGAIRPDLLERVRRAYLEVPRRPAESPVGFTSAYRNETWELRSSSA